MPCVVTSVLAALAPAGPASAQARGDAPIAPAATIGPVTDGSTLSVLGLASTDGSNSSLTNRNELWFGATQRVGQLGRVNFAAMASGNWRFRDALGGDATTQGILAFRARTRVGNQRLWSALSYGQANLDGSSASGLVGIAPVSMTSGNVFDSPAADTTVSRRIDVGRISRAEAGMVSNLSGIEFSFGVSLERASRVTTQTITVSEANAVPITTTLGLVRRSTSRTQRTLQRRDVATGMASMGFNTGSTTWLLSVATPLATSLSSDDLAPKAAPVPTIASIAVVQPVTQWLSLVGAAASNPATMGGAQFRDQVQGGRHDFSPMVALGVRISRFHDRDADGTPGGILAFETRTLGAVDSISIERAPEAVTRIEGDTLRVVLLIDAPRAESVELMGDPTEWSVRSMRRNTSGRWRAELKLAPGMHRIIVRSDGGKWVAPPGLPVSSDDYGSPVGMIVVKGKAGR